MPLSEILLQINGQTRRQIVNVTETKIKDKNAQAEFEALGFKVPEKVVHFNNSTSEFTGDGLDRLTNAAKLHRKMEGLEPFVAPEV